MIPAELYGPFGALAVLSAVLVMIVRGDLVPGWIYKLEQAQRLKAETQAERNADSLAELAKVTANGGPVPGTPGHAK
jgi:hypothetical protein